MVVKYVCRHCGTNVGELHQAVVDEQALGFHTLTPEEREEMVAYDLNGDVTVQMTCDYCTEALNAHPELSLAPSPLH